MSEAEEQRQANLVKAGSETRFAKGWKGGPGRPPGPAKSIFPTPQELAAPWAGFAVKRLKEMCESEDHHVVVKAATALAKLAEPDDDSKLLRMLEDRLRDLKAEADARRQVIESLKPEDETTGERP